MSDELDLAGRLGARERARREIALDAVSPDDGKYFSEVRLISEFLSPRAEWLACVGVQRELLATRVAFNRAPRGSLDEFDSALEKIDPLNISLLEGELRHDQLAVIEEIGRHVSPETKALLHPGTTSYDVLDTARARLFRGAWGEVMRPEIAYGINQLVDIAERSRDLLQVGRTHLQDTSPVTLGLMFSGYARRFAERMERCDESFGRLRGKVSGIVGTGASIDMVMGYGESMKFEKEALERLGLKPDYSATQVTQKETLADVGHGLTTLMHVLGDFANDIRMLYSSAIGEVTSRDNAERLGGSSADATKNNPIVYENMAGVAVVVESGMRVLYEMIATDFQRDLRSSVQARYQPQAMMTQTYAAFGRLSKALSQLSVNEDRLAINIQGVRDNPSEAMVAILRGIGFVHPRYGVGHDFVKEMGKIAKGSRRKLLEVALEDGEFVQAYNGLDATRKGILQGQLENYLGSAQERTSRNIEYARRIANNSSLVLEPGQ